MSFQYKNVYWLWASAIVIFLDQIAKQLIVRNLNWYDVVPVLPHLTIVYMKNTGAAFSMMSDASPVLFVLLGVGVSVRILLWLRRHPRDKHLVATALSLGMAGALGDVLDRLRSISRKLPAWHEVCSTCRSRW